MEFDKQYVILVDEQDTPLGYEEKMTAHRNAILHRAFSVVLFNEKGEALLQRRAWDKYHSPGLWSNTCCSHPFPGEATENAVQRRLREEMNIVCYLEEVFSFVYRTPFDNGLTEYEYDHVFVGYFDGEPCINSDEVAEYKWMEWNALLGDMDKNADRYTVWFRILCAEIGCHRPLLRSVAGGFQG